MLNELGQKISNALTLINNAETIDEKVCIADFRSHELQLMPEALHANAGQSTSAVEVYRQVYCSVDQDTDLWS